MSETVIPKKRFSTLELAYIGIFAAMMAVCSWISIPLPPPMAPFTLQTFAVCAALLILGGKRGFFAILVYILLGMAGVPVFAEFSGGIGVLFGKTGGYIIGFLCMALVYIVMERIFGEKQAIKLAALILGTIVCYAFGTIWFMIVYSGENGSVTLAEALAWCVFPYIPSGIGKLILAWFIAMKVKKYVRL